MQKFDPYHRWLGIPPHEQPPTLYRLLGISDFESDQEVITEASYRQIGHIKQYSSGPHRDAANKILNELSQAQVTLLDLKKKTQYDISIQSDSEDEPEEESAVDIGDGAPVVRRPINRKRRKRSHIPTFLFAAGLLGFVGVTFAYWWSQQDNGESKDAVAKNTDVVDSVDPPAQGTSTPSETPKTNDDSKPSGTITAGASGVESVAGSQTTGATEASSLAETSDPIGVSPSEVAAGNDVGPGESVPPIAADVKPDDLTALYNVRPFTQKALYAGGVKTYEQVSKMTPAELDKILRKGNAPKKGKKWLKAIAEAQALAQKPATEYELGSQKHTGAVTAVSFSPDGKRIVSASDDMTLKLWDAKGEQKFLRTLKGHESNVTCVAFSPEGHRIVTGSWDKTLILWDAGSGKKLRTFSDHSAPVWSVAFSPTGQQIVSGGEDGIKLWDVASGQALRSLAGHSDTVTSVAFSSSGRELVSGSYDGTVKLWNSASGTELRTLSGHSNKVTSVAFSPNGDQVISGSWDKTLVLWEAASGDQLRTFTGHTSAVLTVAFSDDGKQVASGGGDKSILVWDAGSGKKLGAFSGHTDHLNSIAFSPDGRRMVSGAKDQSVRTWEMAGLGGAVSVAPVADDNPPKFFEDPKASVAKNSNSTMPDSNTPNSKTRVTDTSSVTFDGHTGAVGCVAVSSKGKWIVSASADDSLILWDVKKGKKKRTFDELTSQARAVGFSPDNKMIVNGTESGDIELWGAVNGRKMGTLKGHTSAVYSVAFSPNNKQIVSCDSGGAVRVWLAADSSVKKIASNGFKRVAYSADGELIAMGGTYGKLEVWSAIDGKKLQTYSSPSSVEVLSVAFSADSKKLVCGCSDNTIKIWDVPSGEELKTLSGHTGLVKSVSFSPDGDWIVSGSADALLKVWDVDTGKELHTFTGHEKEVTSLAFFSNGNRIVSGSLDKTVKVWDVSDVEE